MCLFVKGSTSLDRIVDESSKRGGELSLASNWIQLALKCQPPANTSGTITHQLYVCSTIMAVYKCYCLVNVILFTNSVGGCMQEMVNYTTGVLKGVLWMEVTEEERSSNQRRRGGLLASTG